MDETGSRASIVHVFPDADAMDLHNAGADDRSATAYEFLQPDGWEIYGEPSPAALEMMRREASAAGVSLTVEPEHIGGFLRDR